MVADVVPGAYLNTHATGRPIRSSTTANLVYTLLQPTPEAWSPDAAKLSEAAMTAASQPGGLGTGPRVTLSDTYRSFRVLNLAERNITTVRGTCCLRRTQLGGSFVRSVSFWFGFDSRTLSNLGYYVLLSVCHRSEIGFALLPRVYAD